MAIDPQYRNQYTTLDAEKAKPTNFFNCARCGVEYPVLSTRKYCKPCSHDAHRERQRARRSLKEPPPPKFKSCLDCEKKILRDARIKRCVDCAHAAKRLRKKQYRENQAVSRKHGLHRLPPEWVFEAVCLWNSGLDTLQITVILGKRMPCRVTEAAVANSLAHAREKRRLNP
jgi:hypothetical protein